MFGFECINVYRNPSGIQGGCSVSSSSSVLPHLGVIQVCAMAQGLQLQKLLGHYRMAECSDLHFKKDYNTTIWYYFRISFTFQPVCNKLQDNT